MTIFARDWQTKKHGARRAYGYDFVRQGVRYVRCGFATKTLARQAEAIHKARLYDARLAREYGIRPAKMRTMLVREFVEKEWLPDQKARLAASTYVHARSHAKKITAALGALRLSDLGPKHLEQWRDARAQGVSPNQIRIDFVWLRRILRAARQRGYLDADPSKEVGLPREMRAPDRILGKEEQARLLRVIRVPTIRAIVEFCLWTALRRQEVCGLTWGQTDLRGRRLLVQQPKTGLQKVIPLVHEAMDILHQFPPGMGAAPVFAQANGKPYQPNALTNYFVRLCRRAGIQGLRLHDLRHTVAVRLLQAGYDIPTVGAILGHKPPYRVTLRYVAHTTERRTREALESLSEKAFGERKNIGVAQKNSQHKHVGMA